jgi:pyruvate kinase
MPRYVRDRKKLYQYIFGGSDMYMIPPELFREPDRNSDVAGGVLSKHLKTKIVATIGPVQRQMFNPQMKLFKQGVQFEELLQWYYQPEYQDNLMIDVARLNMAFYPKQASDVYEPFYRCLESEKDGLAKNIAVLGDLAGAKTRLGQMKDKKVTLRKDATFKLYLGSIKEGDKSGASVVARGVPLYQILPEDDLKEIINGALKEKDERGLEISIADGKVILRVPKKKDYLVEGTIECIVEKEGEIRANDGVTFEKVDLGFLSFDSIDKEALKYLLDLDRGWGVITSIGKIRNGKVKLRKDDHFMINLDGTEIGDQSRACVMANGQKLSLEPSYLTVLNKLNKLKETLEEHDRTLQILIGDVKDGVVLCLYKIENNNLMCSVKRGGTIKSRQRITIDTRRGEGFLAFIGVSFVRTAKDILDVRHFIWCYLTALGYTHSESLLYSPDIISKIETAKGWKNIDSILDVSDGAMIARGDLALQIGRERVPKIQKEIIGLCKKRGKIAITATEMLGSMMTSPNPTRAEVNDVFNAIHDGTDAVMLSNETAQGSYPFHAVEYMAKISARAEIHFAEIYSPKSKSNALRLQEVRLGSEKLISQTTTRLDVMRRTESINYQEFADAFFVRKINKNADQGTTDRICEAACQLAEELQEKREEQSAPKPFFQAIVVSTYTARTCRMISRFRPSIDIIGITRNDINRRKLLLSYGVCPLNIGGLSKKRKPWKTTEEIFDRVVELLPEEKLCRKGESVIFVGGSPLGHIGKVNMLQSRTIPSPT